MPCHQDNNLAPVVQTSDRAIHRINHYPADSVIDFRSTYPLDSNLSGGQRYPTFEQPGPEHWIKHCQLRVIFVIASLIILSKS